MSEQVKEVTQAPTVYPLKYSIDEIKDLWEALGTLKDYANECNNEGGRERLERLLPFIDAVSEHYSNVYFMPTDIDSYTDKEIIKNLMDIIYNMDSIMTEMMFEGVSSYKERENK